VKIIASGLAALALTAAAAPAAAAVNIWSTTFDSGSEYETTGPFPFTTLSTSFGGSSIQGSQALPGFGTNFLRNDTNGTTILSAFGLGAHTALELTFDIAFIDSWDAFDGACCAPDILNIAIDGLAPLQVTSNNAQGTAVYGPGVVVAPLAHYGFNGGWQDVVVRYSFVIPHTAATWSMAINFGGAGFQGGIDESWGLDNFSLAAVPAVGPGGIPEPATWAMMILGFGLSGATLRRRRGAIA